MRWVVVLFVAVVTVFVESEEAGVAVLVFEGFRCLLAVYSLWVEYPAACGVEDGAWKVCIGIRVIT